MKMHSLKRRYVMTHGIVECQLRQFCSLQNAGADLLFNTLTNKNYLIDLKAETGGGAEAVVVFASSKAAFKDAQKTLLVGGLLMVIGLPPEPLEFSAIDLMLGLYRVKAENPGPPRKLAKAIDFSIKHNIKTNVTLHKLEDINEMIRKMEAGESSKRMTVVF